MSDIAAIRNRGRWLLGRGQEIARQPLFANAGYLFGINVLNGGVGFVFWGLAARLYTAEDIGLGSAIISAVTLTSAIAGMGVGNGLVRFLPESSAPRRLMNTAFTFNAALALLVGAVYLAGLDLWSPSLALVRQNTPFLIGFLLYVIASTLGAIGQMVFVARRQASYALAYSAATNVGRLAALPLLAGLGAAGVAGSVGLAIALAVALSLTVLMARVEPGYRPRPDWMWAAFKPLVPYSLGSYTAGLLAQLPQTLIPLLVLEALGPAANAHTYVAWMLGSLLVSPGLALANSAFAEASNDPARSRAHLLRAGALALAVTAPAAGLLALAAPWVLGLFGPGYAAGGTPLLRWLAAAAPCIVLSNLNYTYLRVRKRVRRLMALSGLVAILTMGMALLLIGPCGLAGTGVGWLIGNALAALLGLVFAWREGAGSAARPTAHQEEKGDLMPTSSELSTRLRSSSRVIVAAIPCYNEAHFISDVVQRTQPHVDAVIVVDDGSSDGTAEAAEKAGAQVLRHEVNRGPGAAARTCLQAGCDMQADVLVTLDGDGQHAPEEIPGVVAPILAGEADLVIGSRFLGGYNNVARYRRFGIDVITFLCNFGAHEHITDGQSCFRAYSRRALEVLNITEPGFGFSVETLVQARRAGLRIREASISCVYHEESHSMNPVLHGVGVALMVVKHRLLAALGVGAYDRLSLATANESLR